MPFFSNFVFFVFVFAVLLGDDQINRSDSDSSTLSKKSPFVRNASERRSMRMKKVETTHLVSIPQKYIGQATGGSWAKTGLRVFI